jgi:cyclic pyranopterin phosphate synthase
VQRLQIALKQGGRRAPPYTLASIAAVCAQFTQFRTVPRAMKVIPISNELRPAGPAPVAPLRLPPGEVLRDSYGRELRDLRISVTDRCNFRCVYCMPREVFDKNYAFLPRSALMSFEEITRLVRIFAARGIHKIRLTGGEPLLRKGVEELVAMLAEIPGIELTLTTNGVLLPKLARPLREAGLHRLTVSLDSLDDAIFRRMNDADYPVANVLAGIDAAGAAGFGPVKINMVVKRGMNDAGIVDMARHFRGSGHIPRFIEFMDVGSSNGWELGEVVPSREVVERISAVFPLEPVEPNYTGEVAERWRYVDGGGEIGVISSVTQAFCATCTRLRLSTEGKLFTCLFAEAGHDLRVLLRGGADDTELDAFIAGVWKQRGDRYSELRTAQTGGLRKKIEMSYIGG